MGPPGKWAELVTRYWMMGGAQVFQYQWIFISKREGPLDNSSLVRKKTTFTGSSNDGGGGGVYLHTRNMFVQYFFELRLSRGGRYHRYLSFGASSAAAAAAATVKIPDISLTRKIELAK